MLEENSKYIRCCELITAIASYVRNSADTIGEKEEEGFARFSLGLLLVLSKEDRLCSRCLDFHRIVKEKAGVK